MSLLFGVLREVEEKQVVEVWSGWDLKLLTPLSGKEPLVEAQWGGIIGTQPWHPGAGFSRPKPSGQRAAFEKLQFQLQCHPWLGEEVSHGLGSLAPWRPLSSILSSAGHT